MSSRTLRVIVIPQHSTWIRAIPSIEFAARPQWLSNKSNRPVRVTTSSESHRLFLYCLLSDRSEYIFLFWLKISRRCKFAMHMIPAEKFMPRGNFWTSWRMPTSGYLRCHFPSICLSRAWLTRKTWQAMLHIGPNPHQLRFSWQDRFPRRNSLLDFPRHYPCQGLWLKEEISDERKGRSSHLRWINYSMR